MSMIPALTMGLLAFVSVILIFIVLLQRGRGGGLAGALGGAGGASAFGTKAGDVFTRITIVLAIIWVLLAAICVVLLRNWTSNRFDGGAQAGAQATLTAPDKSDGSSKTDTAAPAGGTASPADGGAARPAGAPEETPADSKPPETKAPEAAPAVETKPAAESAPAEPAKPETPQEEAKQPE